MSGPAGGPRWIAVVDPPGGPSQLLADYRAADARCAVEYLRAVLATRPDVAPAFVFVNGVPLSLYPAGHPVAPFQSRTAQRRQAGQRVAGLTQWRRWWADKRADKRPADKPPSGHKSAHQRRPERTQPPAARSGC